MVHTIPHTMFFFGICASGLTCADCGDEEVAVQHWGPLVPGGIGHFCEACWLERISFFEMHARPMPYLAVVPRIYVPPLPAIHCGS